MQMRSIFHSSRWYGHFSGSSPTPQRYLTKKLMNLIIIYNPKFKFQSPFPLNSYTNNSKADIPVSKNNKSPIPGLC